MVCRCPASFHATAIKRAGVSSCCNIYPRSSRSMIAIVNLSLAESREQDPLPSLTLSGPALCGTVPVPHHPLRCPLQQEKAHSSTGDQAIPKDWSTKPARLKKPLPQWLPSLLGHLLLTLLPIFFLGKNDLALSEQVHLLNLPPSAWHRGACS